MIMVTKWVQWPRPAGGGVAGLHPLPNLSAVAQASRLCSSTRGDKVPDDPLRQPDTQHTPRWRDVFHRLRTHRRGLQGRDAKRFPNQRGPQAPIRPRRHAGRHTDDRPPLAHHRVWPRRAWAAGSARAPRSAGRHRHQQAAPAIGRGLAADARVRRLHALRTMTRARPFRAPHRRPRQNPGDGQDRDEPAGQHVQGYTPAPAGWWHWTRPGFSRVTRHPPSSAHPKAPPASAPNRPPP